MGFLSILGALGPLLGGLFGGGAKGAAEGRAAEAGLTNQANRNTIDLYGTAQGAQTQQAATDLARKGFTETARSGRAKQALIADLLGNMSDTHVNVPGIQAANFSGGLRPSAIGSTGRASLAELAKQALTAQMTPDQFQGGQLLTPPTLQGMPKASGWDKFMNIAGTVGGLAGGVANGLEGLFGGQQQSVVPNIGSVSGLSPELLAQLQQQQQPNPFYSLDQYGGGR
jgi:hypothetical protein